MANRKAQLAAVLVISGLALGTAALADGGQSSGSVGVPLPVGNVSATDLIGRVINYALGLTGVVALAVFVYAGVVWMTAAGAANRVDKAKQAMLWAAVGLMGVFASYAAVSFVMRTLETGFQGVPPAEDTMEFTEEELYGN